MIHLEKKVERRKGGGIRLPQTTSAAEHHRSNLLEEVFSNVHKLTFLYQQKEQETHSR